MSIKINYKKNPNNTSQRNLILFSNEKFDLKPLKKHMSGSDYNLLSDLIKIFFPHLIDINFTRSFIEISWFEPIFITWPLALLFLVNFSKALTVSET